MPSAHTGRDVPVRLFGELEAVLMDHLWSAEEALTVREVRERLDRQPPLAYTTVMTVLDNLHRKGFLSRERAGRAFRYWPSQGRAEYTAELMHELLTGSGDSNATLLKFLDQMSATEVNSLRQVLRD